MIAWLRRNRCGALLAVLVLLILIDPVVAISDWISIALTVLLLASLLLVAWSLRVRGPVLLALVVLGLVVMAVLFAVPGSSHWSWVAAEAALTAFTAIVTICLLQYVLNREAITADKVFAAIDAYVLIGFTFASLYTFLGLVQPNAFHVTVPGIEGPFSWIEMMYFSFTVLTTTGFGEITPATNLARSLIVIEQVLGVMYVAFLVARLVNLYGRDPRR
jgi:hypothetical protein